MRALMARGGWLGVRRRTFYRPVSKGDMATDLRERILEAATRLFAQQGYARTSMREVSEAVGCTKPALYYHFDSKKDLFVATVQTHLDHFTVLLEGTLAAPGSLRERLEALFTIFLDSIQERPEVMRLLMTVEHRPDEGQPVIDLMSMHMKHEALIGQIISDGVEQGVIRGDLALTDVTTSLAGLVNIWGMHCLHGKSLSDDLPRRILDIFFHGVSPR